MGLTTKLDEKTRKLLLRSQRNEITEFLVYKNLSNSIKNPVNKKILKQIAEDELSHYNFFKKFTQKNVKPNNFKVWLHFLISRLFGLTFGLKLMEQGENQAQETYEVLSKTVPETKKILMEEDEHEKKLLNLIEEEKLKYVGSIVLGLNDALVELTGALAGFTFALQNTRLIAVVGLITGIAASLSMAASEYLSTKSEQTKQNPLKASLYTGAAYTLTVLLLILPFLVLSNAYLALGLTVVGAVVIIFVFNFYVSIAKNLSFKKRFFEMALISLGITALTFFIGFLVREFFGLEL
jgi:VIT1/CCC1 family predicted Fe2+/Mn2+ transporter